MKFPAILKKKSVWIILAILIVGGVWYYSSSQAAKTISYETVPAEQRLLLQTVEVTGEVKPAARIDLAFEVSGQLDDVNVKIGDKVKKGDLLAELVDTDLIFATRRAQATMALAQAGLNLRLAGESNESLRVSEAQYQQAKAAYDKAVTDYDSTKIQVQNDLDSAKLAFQTAENNLNNTSPISDQALANAIESSRVSLLSALGPVKAALVAGDSIVGVDDTASNQNYKNLLGALSDGSLTTAQNSYRIAKASMLIAEKSLNSLDSSSDKQAVLNAAQDMSTAIEQTQQFIIDVKYVLANTIPSSYFSSTEIDSKKTTMDSQYSGVSAQKTTVLSSRQSLETATLSNTNDKQKLLDAYTGAKLNYDVAQKNVDLRLQSARSAMDIQKAAMDSAKAAWDLKAASPRSVDLAGLRAQVQDAQVALDMAQNNLNKARIFAPVDGTITDVVSDIGEQITPNTPQIRMIGTASYDIEAKVPESDIGKVKVGQEASITLDAFGDDLEFKGTVTAENPDQTKVQDAIYYNIRTSIEHGEADIKPGMTANVTVTTAKADNAIVIPLRAIKTQNDTDKKTVRILVDGKSVEREVTTGLKGDEGKIQILKGVDKDDAVIVSEKSGS